MTKESVSGNFDIWSFHLRNSSHIYLATPTLDVDIQTTNQNIEKV